LVIFDDFGVFLTFWGYFVSFWVGIAKGGEYPKKGGQNASKTLKMVIFGHF
jgi:hypothetical protein